MPPTIASGGSPPVPVCALVCTCAEGVPPHAIFLVRTTSPASLVDTVLSAWGAPTSPRQVQWGSMPRLLPEPCSLPAPPSTGICRVRRSSPLQDLADPRSRHARRPALSCTPWSLPRRIASLHGLSRRRLVASAIAFRPRLLVTNTM